MREEWHFMFDNKVFMLPWINIIGWYGLSLFMTIRYSCYPRLILLGGMG